MLGYLAGAVDVAAETFDAVAEAVEAVPVDMSAILL